jgi:hypothetical protein
MCECGEKILALENELQVKISQQTHHDLEVLYAQLALECKKAFNRHYDKCAKCQRMF